MNILHINDKLQISGGVEVYIDQLCMYGEQYGITNEWFSIQKSSGSGYLFESKKATIQLTEKFGKTFVRSL